jgi:hypothetical protein
MYPFASVSPLANLRCKWVCQLSDRASIGIVKQIRANGVPVLEHLGALVIGQPVVDLCRLPSSTEPDDQTRGTVTRLPRQHLAVKCVSLERHQ